MRFNINLATQPYENARQFYVRAGALLALAAMVAIALVTLAGLNFWRTREVAAQARQVRAQLHELEQVRDQAQAVMDRPENRTVRDRSQFLNGLIARKAFSWTQILAELERIMPPRAQVTAIRPQVNQNLELELRLNVAGANREAGLELVRRMEQSGRFRDAQLLTETSRQIDTAAPVQMEVGAIYVPEPPSARREPTAGGTD